MNTFSFEVSTFDGKCDFESFKKKMRVLLSHHKVAVALETYKGKWTVDHIEKEANINEVALTLSFFHLVDNVIRQIDGMDTSLSLWAMLDSLYSIVLALESSLFEKHVIKL